MNTPPILYQVRLADPAGHRFSIRLEIARPDPNGQCLRLPAWIPGSYLIRDFARQIESLKVTHAARTVEVHKTDSSTWQCAPVRGPLVIEYTVYAWDHSVRGAHFDQTHAFFNGTSLFLAVSGQEGQPCVLELLPPADYPDWRVWTSLPRADGESTLRGFGRYRAPDYDALIDHPVEIGTPQVARFKAHGALHELVFTGLAPGLDLARIARDARRICAAQIALFEPDSCRAAFLDSGERYVFLITITPDGYGGLEHRTSSALVTRRADLPAKGAALPEGYASFLGLISHEYFHCWLVKRIKPAAFAPYDLGRPNHTTLLWVFEGFTSYYDDLMLLRAGVITERAYFKLLARNFDQLRRAGGRHKQSLAESSFDAWTRYYKQDENSPNALVSYYAKGALLALYLDLEIRARSGQTRSLDDVLRLLWQEYGRQFYQGQPRGVGEQEMPALIARATGVDVADLLARYVHGCDDLPLDEALRATSVTLTATAPHPRPELDARIGPDPAGLRLLTVYENGAAHQAGLSAGDLLIALDGLHITNQACLDQMLDARRPGDLCEVHCFRRDELHRFQIRLAEARPTRHSLRRVPKKETP